MTNTDSTQSSWKRYAGPHGTRRRVRALERRLEKVHGPFAPKKSREPLDELILTVLSQATNDKNSLTAFKRLKRRFPTWQEARTAPRADIEEAIRPGGLSQNKSRTITKILSKLLVTPLADDPLEHLAEAPLSEAVAELTALPGVGIKTAACVLLFSFGRPIMPVDTHVHRLSGRLGLTSHKATADQTHHVLMALTPQDLLYPLHLWLIAHGRSVCHARRPVCSDCVLADLCPSSGS